VRRVATAWLVAGVSWVVMEVCGGLAFLAAGVRLWRYEILPLCWDITSPVVWCIAAAAIPALCMPLDRFVDRNLPPRAVIWARLAFFMTVGPIAEVLINELLFKRYFGSPLYRYLVLPTFDGSGSALSPFYYATLLIHYPLLARLRARWPAVIPLRDSLDATPDRFA
jgi:hypothetical protein